MINDLIKENNVKIEKERKITSDMRKSKVYMKKEMKLIERHMKCLERQNEESAENSKQEKEKLSD